MADRKTIALHAPLGGIHKRHAFQSQPPYTTPDSENYRPDCTIAGRERGGSRPGVTKFFQQQLGGGAPVRMLNTITYVSSDAINSRIVAIANGLLYRESIVGTLALAGSTGGAFNAAKLIHSAERNQVLYIADHSDTPSHSSGTYQPKKYDPITDTISNWTASDGTIPYGCPCIALWRDRILLSGGTTTPYGLFASRQGDAEDWDFSETDTGAAWALGLADAGQVGDVVTCLAPHTDNCLLVGCPTTLWILRGDPGFGGTIDNLSSHVGVVDRGAWCTTPDGLFVFLSADGIYSIASGCEASRYPTSLSRERMPEELLNIDRTIYTVAMAFDVRDRGIHICLARNTLLPPDSGINTSTHWWFDWEQKSFWKVLPGSASYEPFAIHARRNYASSLSNVLLGCRDGYVRHYSLAIEDDDGTDFPSYVWLGPFGDMQMYHDTTVDEIIGILADGSDNITWSLHTGNSPEEAFAAEADYEGVWVAGRNNSQHPRIRGQSTYLKLSHAGGAKWAMESGLMVLSKRGKTRP